MQFATVFIVFALLAVAAGSFLVTRVSRGLAIAGAPPLLVGAAITLLCSTPEMAVILSASRLSVSRDAGLDMLGFGHHIPVGLVLGSSIVNLLLVAGLSALIVRGRGIAVRPTTIFRDAFLMLVLVIVGFVTLFTNHLSTDELIGASAGWFLVGLGVIYLVSIIGWDLAVPAREAVTPNDRDAVTQDDIEETQRRPESARRDSTMMMLMFFLFALGVLFIGVFVLFTFMYPELPVGESVSKDIVPPHRMAVLLPLLVSLPELFTAFWAAALIKESGTASISSLLSSSIFNLTFVFGLAVILAIPSSDKLSDAQANMSNRIERVDLSLNCVPVLPNNAFALPANRSDLCPVRDRNFDLSRLPHARGLYVDRGYFGLEARVLLIAALLLSFLLLTDRLRFKGGFRLLPYEGAILLAVFLVYGFLRYGGIIAETIGSESDQTSPIQSLLRVGSDPHANFCHDQISEYCERTK